MDPQSRDEVTLSLRESALPDASALPAHPLSRDELAANCGAKPEDDDKVATVLTQYGIAVDASTPQPGVGYQAGAGFDAVSGWGVPDRLKLLSL